MFEASSGLNATRSFCDLLFSSASVCWFSVMPVSGVVTVTVHVSVYPPSLDVTVIVAVPLETAVTLPVLSTVATAVSELCHAAVLSVASEGCTFETS